MSLQDEVLRYEQQTPRSRAAWQEARKYLPGGDTRTSVFWPPYPLFFTHGEGARIWDEDGVARVDFINNFTSLPHGHADPSVSRAIREQAARGTSFGGGNEHQVRLARMLCERVPSIELVRFANSGTEATLNCLRAARAFTGRDKIAKAEGGYHGTHDAVSVSVKMGPDLMGDPRRPEAVASTAGVPQSAVRETVVLPFNDTVAARRILEEHAGELAAVIVEPMLGSAGMIPAEPAYLAMLREVCSDHGMLLIFDEVVSLRVGPGGAQARYGITPDLTAMGKMIGGGLPVGGFGGRADVMELFDPTKGPVVSQAGTFTGNPLTMAAGIATLEKLTPEIHARQESLRDRLAQGISDVAGEFDVPVRVTGMGPFYGMHFVERPIANARDAATVDQDFKRQVFLGLMNEGILVASYMVGALSTPMGEAEVDEHLDALRRVLARR
ncbi:MAG: aspartate aminotransferase family protein [Chloroflexi bacterium]|nr:aspartate aminotransferase family protein [Chloroflexota bacterium]MCI0816013.1 aspartate aminotransferase family protein [Chloroflexota bacterium]